MGEEKRHKTEPAESQIQRAQREGVFDNLPGAGKPIPGLDQPYDEMWWVKGLLKRENLSLTPDTLLLRSEIEKTLQELWTLASEFEVRQRAEALNALIRKMNSTATVGPATNLSPMDVEDFVRRWRERQPRPIGTTAPGAGS